jgi:hypothetical protein
MIVPAISASMLAGGNARDARFRLLCGRLAERVSGDREAPARPASRSGSRTTDDPADFRPLDA